MLTDVQIRMILMFVKENPGKDFHTTDRDIYLYLDEIQPYVTGYEHRVRGFSYTGLSSRGESFLANN